MYKDMDKGKNHRILHHYNKLTHKRDIGHPPLWNHTAKCHWTIQSNIGQIFIQKLETFVTCTFVRSVANKQNDQELLQNKLVYHFYHRIKVQREVCMSRWSEYPVKLISHINGLALVMHTSDKRTLQDFFEFNRSYVNAGNPYYPYVDTNIT